MCRRTWTSASSIWHKGPVLVLCILWIIIICHEVILKHTTLFALLYTLPATDTNNFQVILRWVFFVVSFFSFCIFFFFFFLFRFLIFIYLRYSKLKYSWKCVRKKKKKVQKCFVFVFVLCVCFWGFFCWGNHFVGLKATWLCIQKEEFWGKLPFLSHSANVAELTTSLFIQKNFSNH